MWNGQIIDNELLVSVDGRSPVFPLVACDALGRVVLLCVETGRVHFLQRKAEYLGHTELERASFMLEGWSDLESVRPPAHLRAGTEHDAITELNPEGTLLTLHRLYADSTRLEHVQWSLTGTSTLLSVNIETPGPVPASGTHSLPAAAALNRKIIREASGRSVAMIDLCPAHCWPHSLMRPMIDAAVIRFADPPDADCYRTALNSVVNLPKVALFGNHLYLMRSGSRDEETAAGRNISVLALSIFDLSNKPAGIVSPPRRFSLHYTNGGPRWLGGMSFDGLGNMAVVLNGDLKTGYAVIHYPAFKFDASGGDDETAPTVVQMLGVHSCNGPFGQEDGQRAVTPDGLIALCTASRISPIQDFDFEGINRSLKNKHVLFVRKTANK